MSQKYPAMSVVIVVCVIIAVLCVLASIVVVLVAATSNQFALLVLIPALLLVAFWHVVYAETLSAFRNIAIDTAENRRALRQIVDELRRQARELPMFQTESPPIAKPDPGKRRSPY
jgi:ABC-type transport system involved in cytochrome bd biosynthesis fused ATPase/permease subunit